MPNTPEILKQELIDHLHSLDKEKMSLHDLGEYAQIVRAVSEMSQPSPFAAIQMMTEAMKPASPDVPAVKGGVKRG